MPYTQDFYRGILVRDPRFSAQNVTVTPTLTGQAGPNVDAFVAQSGSSGHTELEATGTSTANQKYEIYAGREGFTISGDASGRFIWRPQVDGAGINDNWRGTWPYPFISGSKVWAVKQGSALKMLWPSMISSSDDYVHLAYYQKVEGSAPDSRVFYASLDPATDTWSTPFAMPMGKNGAPSLVELDGGQLLMFIHDGNVPTVMHRFWSADRGVTWNEGTDFITGGGFGLVSPDFSLGNGGSMTNFQVVHHNGYLTMIRTFQTPRSEISAGAYTGSSGTVQAVETDHYVSRDFGASWELIERFQRFDAPETGPVGRGTTTKNIGICPQIITDETGTVFLLWTDDYDEPISGAPRFIKKTTPYGKFSEDPTHGSIHSRLGLPGGTDATGGLDKSNQPRETSSNDGQMGHFVICKDRENKLMVICNYGQAPTGNFPNHFSTGALFRYDFKDPRYLLNDSNSHIRGWFDCADKENADTQWTLFDMFGSPIGVSGSITGFWGLIRQSAAVAYKDKILVMLNTPSERTGGGLQGGTLGGHCLVTLSGANEFDSQTGFSSVVHIKAQDRDGFTYLPIDSPLAMVTGVTGVTKQTSTASGSGCAFEISTNGLRLSTAADSILIRHAGEGLHARVRAANTAGLVSGALTANFGTLEARGIQVRLSKTHAQVWDCSASATGTQASDAVELPTEERDWIILRRSTGTQSPALTTFSAAVFYKKPTEQMWTRFPTYHDVLASNITNINQRLQADDTGCAFGAGTGTLAGTTNAIFFQFVNMYGSTFSAYNSGWYSPERTNHSGRALSLHPQWIDDGWKVAAQGGPTMFGDTWKAETRYEFGIEQAHPEVSPSPRVEWRSVNDDSEVTITWNPQGSIKTKPTAAAWGVHLDAINWGTCHLEGYDGSSWTLIDTISTETDGDGLKYARTGDTIGRDTSYTGSNMGADRYYQLDELVGCYLVSDPGGGSERVHKIVANSEGGFYRTSTGAVAPKETEIRIEPTASMPLSTGTCNIRQANVTQVVNNPTKWEQIRIRIPAQITAEGYFKAGAIIVGDVFVFGRDYSWGRQLTIEPNQEITTGRSGDRLVEQLGPARRRVEFSWADGWDSSAISGEDPTTYTGVELAGKIVAVREDTSIVEGVLTRAKGAKEPVVYLPRIYQSFGNSNDPIIPEITGRTRHMYGRIVSKVTKQTLIGDEDKNEVHTINAVSIDEEI